MLSVVVVGAGHIGSTIASFLADSGDYRVTVLDRCERSLAALPKHPAIRPRVGDAGSHDTLVGCMDGAFAVLSAAPYHQTVKIAEAARVARVHYLDLTEDVASTRVVKALAVGAETAFIPQCGLAPGFISIVAADLAARFDALHDLRLRVGALPKYPSNALNYNLTWSTDGVINEYCEPCEAIVDGQLRHTRALEELESFSLDGVTYEAFNTSGGLGSLCETLAGKVRNLNYRTIRYPGHAAIMKALLNDLRLRDRRDLLKDILEHAVPVTLQGRGHRLRRRIGDASRQARAGDVCAQDLRTRDRRTHGERDPDHHGLGDLRGDGHAGRWGRARPRLRQPGKHTVDGLSGEPLRAGLCGRSRGPRARGGQDRGGVQLTGCREPAVKLRVSYRISH